MSTERLREYTTDRFGDWCATLEHLRDKDTSHPWRQRKLDEICTYLRAQRYAPERLRELREKVEHSALMELKRTVEGWQAEAVWERDNEDEQYGLLADGLSDVLDEIDRLLAAEPEWTVKCPVCCGEGVLKEAVQAWDVYGAPVPECPHCEDGVLDLGKLLASLSKPATASPGDEERELADALAGFLYAAYSDGAGDAPLWSDLSPAARAVWVEQARATIPYLHAALLRTPAEPARDEERERERLARGVEAQCHAQFHANIPGYRVRPPCGHCELCRAAALLRAPASGSGGMEAAPLPEDQRRALIDAAKYILERCDETNSSAPALAKALVWLRQQP